jgi:serpin B
MKEKDLFRMIAILSVALIVPLTGCTDPGIVESGDEVRWDGNGLNETGATEQGVEAISDAMNRFGIEMYLQLLNGADNVFISPYSIFTALSMTYEGARGETASEMASIMHYPDNDTIRRASFARIQNLMVNGTNDYELTSANKIWPREDYPFMDPFFDLIKEYYYGGIEELDFAGDPEGSRQTINQWVENRTNDRIKDLIPQGVIDPTTVMVLTNAIYFLGTWLYEFNEEETQELSFYLSDGRSIEVETMGMKVKDGLDYYEDSDLQALELPYKGENLSMIVLLPKDNDVSGMESRLDAEMLDDIISGMGEKEVNVFMPKFEMTVEYKLNNPLIDLGMVRAFQMGMADFSGMNNGYEPLFISDVLHKSFIKVDEEGTEATAATAVVMKNYSGGGDDSVTFRADHPFLFFIMHKETNSVLFMGKVEDPSS